MSSTVVRIFNVGDSVKVADFLSKVFLEEGRPRPADEVSSLVRSWIEEQSKGMTPFIAFRDEIAVGLLLLDERSPSITYIQWLHVLTHYRRQKVGSNLMETALERVWARGIPLASLHTAPDNIAAQGLYTKYGFVSMQPPGGYMVNFQRLPLLNHFLKLHPKAEATPLGKQIDFQGQKVYPFSWKDESTERELTLYFTWGLAGARVPVEDGSLSTYLISSVRAQAPGSIPVLDKETTYVKLVLENESSREVSVAVKIGAPSLLRMRPKRRRFAYSLPRKERASFVYAFGAPISLKPTSTGAFLPIGLEVSINHYTVPLETGMRVTEPFEVSVSPARVSPNGGEMLKLRLDVKSGLYKVSTLTIKLEPSKDWVVDGTGQFSNVIPGETVSLDFHAVAPPKVEPGSLELPVKIAWAEGGYEAKARLAVGLPMKCPTCGGFIQYPYWATVEGVKTAFCREACAKDYGLPEPEMRKHRLWEAVKRGHRWLSELRRPDGGWRLPQRDGSLVYPGTCGLSALASFEGGFSPMVQASRQWLIGVQAEEGSIGHGASTTSSAVMSLLDAGEPPESPSLTKAASYLKRVQTVEGYWSGWMGPELTTLYCIQALTRLGETATSKTIESSVSWVLSKQNPDGSFFDVHAPAVRAEEVLAVTTLGLTALTLLCIADVGVVAEPQTVSKALDWLIKMQQPEGFWGTREKPNPFDTVMAVQALFTYKGLEAKTHVMKGVEWLINNQQPNGSWGDLMGATHIITQSLVKMKALTQIY